MHCEVTYTPDLLRFQPEPVLLGRKAKAGSGRAAGEPPYRTSTVNIAPAASGTAGWTTSSVDLPGLPSRSGTAGVRSNDAAWPFTRTPSTSRPSGRNGRGPE